jgi:hypothetical protein
MPTIACLACPREEKMRVSTHITHHIQKTIYLKGVGGTGGFSEMMEIEDIKLGGKG